MAGLAAIPNFIDLAKLAAFTQNTLQQNTLCLPLSWQGMPPDDSSPESGDHVTAFNAVQAQQ